MLSTGGTLASASCRARPSRFRHAGRVDVDLPIPFGPVSNGEYDPAPLAPHVEEALRRTQQLSDETARRLGVGRREFLRSACGAAAAFLVLGACRDESNGEPTGGRYDVPEEAVTDTDAAREAVGGDELVFDVQTHFLAYDLLQDRGASFWGNAFPQARCGEDDPRACFSIEHYLEELFLRSDTNLAVISAIPIPGPSNPLSIDDMARARGAAEALCEDERLFLHGQALPSTGALPDALDGMSQLVDDHPIKAWKVYTHAGGPAWYLDDHDPDAPQVGNAFLERAAELGVTTVCVHKGFSGGSLFASPVDIGPAAAAHPDIDFVVYHSGYESGITEGAYSDATADMGVNRLITSLRDAGVGPGQNVYAELGSTWFNVMRDPEEAAHTLGKLLTTVGEDRVVWGTDSIWYGSPQAQLQAFRAFQIGEQLQEQHGYPALTDDVKAKILGGNSAALYEVEPVTTRCDFTRDELEALRVALPPSRRTYGPETAAEVHALAAEHGWVGF